MANPDDDIKDLPPGAVASDGDAIRAAGDLSWMEGVRAERDEAVKVEELHLGFPTWGTTEFPSLVITYGVVSRPELEKFQRQSQKKRKKGETASDIDIEFLVRASRKAWVRSPEDDKLYRVPEARLNKALGRALGLDEEKNANSHTLLAYLSKDNGVALGNLAMRVAGWMTNTSAQVAEAVLEDALIEG